MKKEKKNDAKKRFDALIMLAAYEESQTQGCLSDETRAGVIIR